MIVGLLTQETTTFTGRYYQLSEARNEPKPVQRPHPPICVGGSGERGHSAPQPDSPSTGTSWAGRRTSSPASGTSCISTARISAATRRRFSSPVMSIHRGRQVHRRQAATLAEVGVEWALSTSARPWIPAY